MTKSTFTIAEQHAAYGVLRQMGESVEIDSLPDTRDIYTVACELRARYRLDLCTIMPELRRLYGREDIPLAHVDHLARQIEDQTRNYEVTEEKVDVALALVKPDGGGFEEEVASDGTICYTAEIVYPKDKERLLLRWQRMKASNPRDLGFHYDPYNFDSNPEMSFFEQMLAELNVDPKDVEDIYFTGAFTDPGKTDFFVWYKDDKGKWRRYTPDFLIRKKPVRGKSRGSGKVLIVEVKGEFLENHPNDGRDGNKAVAMRRWEKLNPDRLKYQMIFTATDAVSADQLQAVRRWKQLTED